MKRIRLPSERVLSEAEEATLRGKKPTPASWLLCPDESCVVERPDGTTLAVLLRKAIPPEEAEPCLRLLRRDLRGVGSNNRVSAFGLDEDTGLPLHGPRIRKDGTLASTGKLRVTEFPDAKGIISAVLGYFERTVRFPFCRATAPTLEHPEMFAAVSTVARRVQARLGYYMPTQAAFQWEAASRTPPEFVIPGTSFTTVTVNRNFQTAYHRDAGDLSEGFGALALLRAGLYRGGELVIPKYRVAFDLRDRDVLLYDVHELHGNRRFIGKRGTFERWSMIFYFREKMIGCGCAAEELRRVKARKAGDPLFAKEAQ